MNTDTNLLKPPLKASTGGRPAYQLTPEIEAFICSKARLGCSLRSIALSLGVSEDVLTGNIAFSDTFKKGRAEYLISLHENQHDLAFNGNPFVKSTMSIWLGKQDLGQSDKREDTGSVAITIRLEDARPALDAEVKVLAPGPDNSRLPDSSST